MGAVWQRKKRHSRRTITSVTTERCVAPGSAADSGPDHRRYPERRPSPVVRRYRAITAAEHQLQQKRRCHVLFQCSGDWPWRVLRRSARVEQRAIGGWSGRAADPCCGEIGGIGCRGEIAQRRVGMLAVVVAGRVRDLCPHYRGRRTGSRRTTRSRIRELHRNSRLSVVSDNLRLIRRFDIG